MNPLKRFKTWQTEEAERSKVKFPSACVLSTLGMDGYPNSRFVSLKEIIDDQFVITGPLTSRKSKELLKHPKCALTFWWPTTERQVRIQGNASRIEDGLADAYFKMRNSASQIVSHISKQGETIENINTLKHQLEEIQTRSNNDYAERPKDWSGFYINPIRIEFLEFDDSRLHLRQLFEKKDQRWSSVFLQP